MPTSSRSLRRTSFTWGDPVELTSRLQCRAEPAPAPATSFTWGEPEEPDEPVEAASPPTTYMPLSRLEPGVTVDPVEPESPEPAARVVPVLGPVGRPAFDRPRDARSDAGSRPRTDPGPEPAPETELEAEADTEPTRGDRGDRGEAREGEEEEAKGKKSRAEKSKDKKSVATEVVGLRVGSSHLIAAHVHNDGRRSSSRSRASARARDRRRRRGSRPAGAGRRAEGLLRRAQAAERAVRLGIASNRIGVRVLEVPAIEDPQAVRELDPLPRAGAFPFPSRTRSSTTSCSTRSPGPTPRRRLSVLLVFSHRELVDRHVDACRLAGLKLVGIDFEAFALLRALAEPRPADAEPECARRGRGRP